MSTVFDNDDLDRFMDTYKAQESAYVVPVSGFEQDFTKFAEEGKKMSGAALPWDRTHEYIRFNPGQLTVWAGENGSGKSVLLGQVVQNFGGRFLVASLEMRPVETLYRMACQHFGRKIDGLGAKSYCDEMDGRLWVYDQLDSVEWERIIVLIHYARELGCSDIILDSLVKCGLSRDDYAIQAKFVDKLQWAAKATGIHIHLVAHTRKPSQGEKPSKYSIRGAAEISDLADTVFILRRNYRKEEEAEKPFANQDQEVLRQPDAFLRLDKNRHYGELRTWGLQFNPESMNFTDYQR